MAHTKRFLFYFFGVGKNFSGFNGNKRQKKKEKPQVLKPKNLKRLVTLFKPRPGWSHHSRICFQNPCTSYLDQVCPD